MAPWLALAVSAVLLAAPTAPEVPPPGEVVARVDCAAFPGQSYALYLPRAYSPGRRWPILYAFDARERGDLPVERFRGAAEELGWIVAGSNNSRSDEPPAAGNVAALRAVWEDTHARLAIDPRRVYATGFSGGARLACLLGLGRAGEVAGVVGCGGGFPPDRPPSDRTRFAFVGLAGDRDFNFHELWDLDRRLGELGLPHRFLSFSGGHQWPPESAAREALYWLELLAMQASTAPVRPELVAALWTEGLAAARAEETAGDPVAALRRLEALERDFAGLRATAAATAEAARLRTAPLYVRELAAQEAAEQQYAAYVARSPARVQALLAREPGGFNLRLALGRLEVPDLERRAAAPSYAGRAAQRALETLFVQTGYYLPRALSARGDDARAALLLAIAAELKPAEPRVWYELAGAQARAGETRRAIDSLRRAVAAGFADRERLGADPAFARLRDDRRFRALLEGLPAAAASPESGAA